ncbi:MAG: alpha/beta hydrolase [Aquihabitans sp.]
MTGRQTVHLTHVRVELALHQLRAGDGRALLMLHGLGEDTPVVVPSHLAAWPGPIWGLDFTGHGASTVPAGGGYTAEILMADVDCALAHIGDATLVGRGLGAYVALLAAGACASLVTGAILADGPGLAGGGPSPHSPSAIRVAASRFTPDPYALIELARDIRPPDYATDYARQAAEFSGLDTSIAVVSRVRPPWLATVADEPGVLVTTMAHALTHFATAIRSQPV